MNEIKPIDAKAAINRIRFTHPAPKDTNLDALAEIWASVLKGVTRLELSAGVEAFFRDGGRFFPKPAEIRKLALDSRTTEGQRTPDTLHNRYLRWEQDHGDEGCPVCGAKVKELSAETRRVLALEWDKDRWQLVQTDYATGPVRAGVFHNLAKHHEKRIPAVGHWTEPDDVESATWVGERPDHRLTESLR